MSEQKKTKKQTNNFNTMWGIVEESEQEEIEALKKKEVIHQKIEQLEKKDQTKEVEINLEKLKIEEAKATKDIQKAVRKRKRVAADFKSLDIDALLELKEVIKDKAEEPRILNKGLSISEDIWDALDEFTIRWKKIVPGVKKGALAEFAIASMLGVGVERARERAGMRPLKENRDGSKKED